MSTEAKKTMAAIDICKFLMAICVIAIHTHPLVNLNNATVVSIYESFITLAMPFFFVSSGYFLKYKMLQDSMDEEQKRKSIKSFLIKYCKIYLMWTFLYLPITMYGFFIVRSDLNLTAALAEWLRNILMKGENYYSWPLWYLLGTIYAAIFLLFTERKRISDLQRLVFAAIIMLIAQVMTWLVIHQWDLQGIWQTIAVWISNTFGSGRVFTGIFYMCVGVCLASYGSKVSVIKTPVMTFLLLVVFVIDVKTTAFTVSAICEMILSALFFECVRRIHIKERKLYLGLRQSSKIMYFTHMIFYFIYSRAADKIEPRGVQPFFVVLICCLIVSVIVIECKKIRRRVWHLI